MSSSGTLANGVNAYSSTLVASTADTVTFSDRYGYVTVTNTGTTGVIYARADGVAATVAGNSNIAVNPGQTVVIANGLALWNPVSTVTLAGVEKIPTGSGSFSEVPTSPTQGTSPAQPGRVHPMMSSLAGKVVNPGTLVSVIGAGTNTYTVAGTG